MAASHWLRMKAVVRHAEPRTGMSSSTATAGSSSAPLYFFGIDQPGTRASWRAAPRRWPANRAAVSLLGLGRQPFEEDRIKEGLCCGRDMLCLCSGSNVVPVFNRQFELPVENRHHVPTGPDAGTPSPSQQAGVEDELRAGDEPRLVRSEVHDGRGHVFRLDPRHRQQVAGRALGDLLRRRPSSAARPSFIGVFTPVGCSDTTRMLYGANSIAHDFVSPTRPHFDAA